MEKKNVINLSFFIFSTDCWENTKRWFFPLFHRMRLIKSSLISFEFNVICYSEQSNGFHCTRNLKFVIKRSKAACIWTKYIYKLINRLVNTVSSCVFSIRKTIQSTTFCFSVLLVKVCIGNQSIDGFTWIWTLFF